MSEQTQQREEDETSADRAEQKKAGRKKEFFRVLKYTLFAASAGIIQIVSFSLLDLIPHINYWLAYLPSLVLSVLWNFTFNRKFTFHSANNVPVAMCKVVAYYLVFTPLSTWWGDALEKAGWNEYAILVPTMLINFVTEFLYNRFFVFGKSVDTDVRKKNGKAANGEADCAEKKSEEVLSSAEDEGLREIAEEISLLPTGEEAFPSAEEEGLREITEEPPLLPTGGEEDSDR